MMDAAVVTFRMLLLRSGDCSGKIRAHSISEKKRLLNILKYITTSRICRAHRQLARL